MAEQYKPKESLATIRARLLAGPSKRVRKVAGRGGKTAKPTSRELWAKAYAKINAERVDDTSAGDMFTSAPSAPVATTSASVRAAQKRGMVRLPE